MLASTPEAGGKPLKPVAQMVSFYHYDLFQRNRDPAKVPSAVQVRPQTDLN